jgi:hypothetical protein
MYQFVVLAHDFPEPHLDFFLETSANGLLRSFRLSAWPTGGKPVDLLGTPDHRRLYLQYEGPVSGGRGSVRRLDAGYYELTQEEAHRLVIRLFGQALSGLAVLAWDESGRGSFRLASDSAAEGD